MDTPPLSNAQSDLDSILDSLPLSPLLNIIPSHSNEVHPHLNSSFSQPAFFFDTIRQQARSKLRLQLSHYTQENHHECPFDSGGLFPIPHSSSSSSDPQKRPTTKSQKYHYSELGEWQFDRDENIVELYDEHNPPQRYQNRISLFIAALNCGNYEIFDDLLNKCQEIYGFVSKSVLYDLLECEEYDLYNHITNYNQKLTLTQNNTMKNELSTTEKHVAKYQHITFTPPPSSTSYNHPFSSNIIMNPATNQTITSLLVHRCRAIEGFALNPPNQFSLQNLLHFHLNAASSQIHDDLKRTTAYDSYFTATQFLAGEYPSVVPFLNFFHPDSLAYLFGKLMATLAHRHAPQKSHHEPRFLTQHLSARATAPILAEFSWISDILTLPYDQIMFAVSQIDNFQAKFRSITLPQFFVLLAHQSPKLIGKWLYLVALTQPNMLRQNDLPKEVLHMIIALVSHFALFLTCCARPDDNNLSGLLDRSTPILSLKQLTVSLYNSTHPQGDIPLSLPQFAPSCLSSLELSYSKSVMASLFLPHTLPNSNTPISQRTVFHAPLLSTETQLLFWDMTSIKHVYNVPQSPQSQTFASFIHLLKRAAIGHASFPLLFTLILDSFVTSSPCIMLLPPFGTSALDMGDHIVLKSIIANRFAAQLMDAQRDHSNSSYAFLLIPMQLIIIAITDCSDAGIVELTNVLTGHGLLQSFTFLSTELFADASNDPHEALVDRIISDYYLLPLFSTDAKFSEIFDLCDQPFLADTIADSMQRLHRHTLLHSDDEDGHNYKRFDYFQNMLDLLQLESIDQYTAITARYPPPTVADRHTTILPLNPLSSAVFRAAYQQESDLDEDTTVWALLYQDFVEADAFFHHSYDTEAIEVPPRWSFGYHLIKTWMKENSTQHHPPCFAAIPHHYLKKFLLPFQCHHALAFLDYFEDVLEDEDTIGECYELDRAFARKYPLKNTSRHILQNTPIGIACRYTIPMPPLQDSAPPSMMLFMAKAGRVGIESFIEDYLDMYISEMVESLIEISPEKELFDMHHFFVLFAGVYFLQNCMESESSSIYRQKEVKSMLFALTQSILAHISLHVGLYATILTPITTHYNPTLYSNSGILLPNTAQNQITLELRSIVPNNRTIRADPDPVYYRSLLSQSFLTNYATPPINNPVSTILHPITKKPLQREKLFITFSPVKILLSMLVSDQDSPNGYALMSLKSLTNNTVQLSLLNAGHTGVNEVFQNIDTIDKLYMLYLVLDPHIKPYFDNIGDLFHE